MRRECRRTSRRRKIGRVEIIFQRDRHAVQRTEALAALTLLVGAPRRGTHRIRIKADEGVEGRRPCASIEQGVDQGLRGDIPGADRGRCFRGTELSEG